MAVSAAQIEKFCDEWCLATHASGGMMIGADTEKHRLLNNGVVFHDLAFDALCAAITGTTKVLLRPGLNTVVVLDHFALWAWCAELLLAPRAGFFTPAQHEISTLFQTTVHAALAHCARPPTSQQEREAQHRINELQPVHAKAFLLNSHVTLAYLSFPLLEAMTKRACATYVAFDGKVLAPFKAPRKSGKQKEYAIGSQCSSLRDLLYLHHGVVASPQTRSLLDKLRAHLVELDSTQEPFDLLYGWRNQSLHGSASFQTIGGTLLSWCFLIALAEIAPNFDARRREALEQCIWQSQAGFRSPWSFYPPY